MTQSKTTQPRETPPQRPFFRPSAGFLTTHFDRGEVIRFSYCEMDFKRRLYTKAEYRGRVENIDHRGGVLSVRIGDGRRFSIRASRVIERLPDETLSVRG